MKRKLNKPLKEAIKAYYLHREASWKATDENRLSTWNKQADLKAIEDAAFSNRPKIVHFEACAGSFIFTWSDKGVTYHGENQWWRMETWDHWRNVTVRRPAKPLLSSV